MGPENNTRTGTLYVNGESIAEVISIQEIKIQEIKIPMEVDPSDFPPILDDFSITFVGKAPKKFWWKLRWMFFKVRVKALIHRIFHF